MKPKFDNRYRCDDCTTEWAADAMEWTTPSHCPSFYSQTEPYESWQEVEFVDEEHEESAEYYAKEGAPK